MALYLFLEGRDQNKVAGGLVMLPLHTINLDPQGTAAACVPVRPS